MQIRNGLERREYHAISTESMFLNPYLHSSAHSNIQANIRFFSGRRVFLLQLALQRQPPSACTCSVCMVRSSSSAPPGLLVLRGSKRDRCHLFACRNFAIHVLLDPHNG